MSLESFVGIDSGEGMSEAAFEQFKQKMKAASAQIQAIRKEEKKQKKQEDELIKILLKFIQTSHKTELVLLISRALEQNVVAHFVLAIVLLGNEEIQQATGRILLTQEQRLQLQSADNNTQALTFFNAQDQSMPLKIKIEIDNWIKNLVAQADENPAKLLKTVYDIQLTELEDEKKIIKPVVINLMAHILQDFLQQHKQEEPISKLKEFSSFVLKGILSKARENLDNVKMIENDREEAG